MPASIQPPATVSCRSEFSYRTHLVIYNFLRLVPSSLTPSPTEEIDEPAVIESSALFTSLSSHPAGGGHEEGDEQGGGDACDSGPTENGGRIDRQGMFDELRTRVAEHDQRRETAARESNQRAAQTRRMLREMMEKVDERNLCVSGDRVTATLPPTVTIIKKNNAAKFLLEPASPSVAIEQTIVASSVPTAMPDGATADSPFGNPLCSSTPSLTPQSVCLPPAVPGESNDVAVDQMSSSGSSSNSAYIDIDIVDDVESLVNAGIVPSVSKPLKDEISLCWQNLERHRSSKINTSSDCV